MLDRADLLVAHNAPFEVSWLERRFPAIAGKPWACSMRDIPWLHLGLDGRAQTALLMQHGWFSSAHRAAADVWALFWLLNESRTGWLKAPIQTHLQRLLTAADTDTLDNERNEELEFLLANLAIRDTRSVPIEESALDLFGSWDRARHYSCWLNGQRLLASGREAYPNSLLSPEGHAVLLMLASTRKPNLAPLPIGLPTLKSFHGLADNPTEDERERLIAEQEKAARHLRYQFTRQDLGGQSAIVLSGVGLGPNIPLTRVLWSMTFLDSYARDRTLFWMHERIDRWLDWGEMAYYKGARAFTEHLLQLAFADRLIDVS